MVVDGIGGIIPGNSFHSTYLPKRYQEETLFQAFDVNHRVGSDGWGVTISGKMRSTFNKMTQTDVKKELKSNIDKDKYPEQTIKDILGGNAMRFITEGWKKHA